MLTSLALNMPKSVVTFHIYVTNWGQWKQFYVFVLSSYLLWYVVATLMQPFLLRARFWGNYRRVHYTTSQISHSSDIWTLKSLPMHTIISNYLINFILIYGGNFQLKSIELARLITTKENQWSVYFVNVDSALKIKLYFQLKLLFTRGQRKWKKNHFNYEATDDCSDIDFCQIWWVKMH